MAQSFRSIIGKESTSASTSDSVLIIIDAQNEYRSGKLQVTNADESSKVIEALLNKYRAANGKLVHVVHETPEGAPIFTPGTELAEEFPSCVAKNGETMVKKQFPGAFEKTNLHELLGSWRIKKLVLTGYMAHVCVSTTAREAFQKGYEVVLVEDGIGDRDIPGVKGEELKRVVLAELNDTFGTVVNSKDIN